MPHTRIGTRSKKVAVSGNQYKATSAIALLVFNKMYQIPFKDKSDDTFIENNMSLFIE